MKETGQTVILSSDFNLENWGTGDIAYIKKSKVNNEDAWGIYAAEGFLVGYAPDLATAKVIIRQNDLEPLSVH